MRNYFTKIYNNSITSNNNLIQGFSDCRFLFRRSYDIAYKISSAKSIPELSGCLFCVTGNSVGITCRTKSPPGRIALRRRILQSRILCAYACQKNIAVGKSKKKEKRRKCDMNTEKKSRENFR